MAATGKNVADVATDRGYSKHTFYRVIKNESQNPKARKIIATLIGKAVDELWPEQKEKTNA